MEYIANAYDLLFYILAEDTIVVEREYSKESLHNERQLASKIISRLEIMHKKEMNKERNGERSNYVP